MNFKKALIPTMMALGVLLTGCGNTENDDNTATTHEHTYSDLHAAIESTFLTKGNIAYYECSGCNKLFNESFEEVTEITTPKISTNLVLLIDGKYTCDFPLVSETETALQWATTINIVKKDETVTVALKEDTNTQINFTGLFGYQKFLHSSTMVKVEAYYTQNGHGFGAGYSTGGLTFDDNYIIVNDVKHPMPTYVSILGYTYGFVDLHKDDKITIFNDEHNVQLSYDDLNDSAKANTSILSRGENNEIIIQRDGKYLIQLKEGGIQFEMVYAPVNTSSVQIDFASNRDAITLDTVTLGDATDSCKEIRLFLDGGKAVMNGDDFKNAIETNGYDVFAKTIELRKNEKFVIKDVTNNQNISGNNYSLTLDKDIYNDFTFNENEIRVNKSGVYKVTYIPFISQIKIEFVEDLVDAYISINGETSAFAKDITDNCIHTNGIDISASSTIAFLDKDNNAIDFALDVSIDPSVCSIDDSSETKELVFKKTGNFDITLDLTTNSVKVIFNSLDGVTPLGNDVSIFVSASRYSMYTTSNNKNELYYTFTYSKNYNISIGVGSGMTSISNELVIDDVCKANMSISQGVIRINEGGNITLYLNKFTRRLRYVKN